MSASATPVQHVNFKGSILSDSREGGDGDGGGEEWMGAEKHNMIWTPMQHLLH